MLEDLRPHLIELRKRLFIILLATLVTFVICFFFWKSLLEIARMPLTNAFDHGIKGKIIQVAPAEAIFVGIKLSLISGLTLSIPIIFWQLWLFVAPGLYKHEQKLVIPFVVFGSIMFVCGLLFCYYIVFPFIIKYILAFGNDIADADISIKEYMSFFMRFMLGFGIVFEMPVIAFFLGKVGLITDETLKHYFKYAVVGVFIIAAIITPPDVLSQLLLALPMVVLYGFAYIILKFVNPASKQKVDV